MTLVLSAKSYTLVRAPIPIRPVKPMVMTKETTDMKMVTKKLLSTRMHADDRHVLDARPFTCMIT